MRAEESPEKKLKRFAKLRPLTERHVPSSPRVKDFDAVFGKFAKQLQKAGEVSRVQFRLRGKRKKTDWSIVLAEDSSKVKRKAAVTSDLRITLSEEDAWDMFRGQVSPIKVFASGRMLISGDCELAKRLYRILAGRGETEFF